MAAPIAVAANEYYETNFIPESHPHPYPALRDHKLILVSAVMAEGELVVLKWPSIRSLVSFFRNRNEILPTLDQECNMTTDDANRIIKDRIDTLDLCFEFGKLAISWLHAAQVILNLCSAVPPVLNNLRQPTRRFLKVDEFYEVDYNMVPEGDIKDAIGFARVAWIGRAVVQPNFGTVLIVRAPTTESLHAFMLTSESRMLPEFSQAFYVSIDLGKSFLVRTMPLDLCLRMRMRRAFWINEFEEDGLNFLLTAAVAEDDDDEDHDAAAAALLDLAAS